MRAEKKEGKDPCQRCTNPRTPHQSDKCYFLDKECRKCKQKGHMAGSQMCSMKEKKIKKVSIEKDYDDPTNWHEGLIFKLQQKLRYQQREVRRK